MRALVRTATTRIPATIVLRPRLALATTNLQKSQPLSTRTTTALLLTTSIITITTSASIPVPLLG